MASSSSAAALALAAKEELEQREQGIAKCISWVNSVGTKAKKKKSFGHVMKANDLFSFESSQDEVDSSSSSSSSSYRPPMVGVFAKKAIPKGQIILTIPHNCILSETHPLVRDLRDKVITQAMRMYNTHVANDKSKSNDNPWDPFAKSNGRILSQEDLSIALYLTLLLFAKRRKKRTQTKGAGGETTSTPTTTTATNGGGQTRKKKKNNNNNTQKSATALDKAAEHWDSYLDTLPHDYSSLIFHWTEEELQNLQGTSCHALAQRLRTEVQKNWDHCFRDILMDYLPQINHCEDPNLLYNCYMDAICGTYSRCHGTSNSTTNTTSSNNGTTAGHSRSLCPLLDLFNGNRDNSSNVNILVLRYPGTHVALQTARDVTAGEELMIPYGNFSNQVFLTAFGFLPLLQSNITNNDDAGNSHSHSHSHSHPQMVPLDAVYVLPPPRLVGDERDPKWEAYASQGIPLQRRHMMENPPHVTSEVGTPFCVLGNRSDMRNVRMANNNNSNNSDGQLSMPSYLINFHVFATTSLLKPKDLFIGSDEQVDYLAPWHPGAFILEMIDYRLQQLQSSSKDQEQQQQQHHHRGSNLRTGTLYRILERDILHMWRHAIAKHYGVYGKVRRKSTGEVWKPLLGQGGDVCATCRQSALSGPLKLCTRCKQVSYCSRDCQVEDWKAPGGHKQSCKPT